MKALALVAAVMLAGCASYGSLTTARPVAPGASQVTTALEIDGVGVVEDDLRIPLPALAVAVRRGLRDDVDVGGKLTMLPLGDVLTGLGLEAQIRWRFLGDADDRVEIAVAPTLGWRSTSSSAARWDAAHAVLPVIVGINLGRHQLFLSPKVGWQRWWSAGATPVDVPFAGAGLGLSWRLRQRLSLVPEVTVLQTPTSMAGSDRAAILTAGIGLVFDGR